MLRATVIVALGAFLALSAAPLAFGQEEPAPVADDSSTMSEIQLPPVSGEKVEVRLRPGEVFTGIVKSRRSEVVRGGILVPAQNKDDPGAGIRIYYAFGLQGYLFVTYRQVKEIKFLGQLTAEEGETLSKELASDMQKAKEERTRVAAERMAKRAAAKRRRGEAEEDETKAEEDGTRKTEAPGGKTPSVDARRQRDLKIRDLLRQFPPTEWKPSRLDEIKKRAIILDIYPSEEERAFMDNHDLWLEGYETWQRARSR